jgi:hypothetical protein
MAATLNTPQLVRFQEDILARDIKRSPHEDGGWLSNWRRNHGKVKVLD